eukprot:Nk52_evm1s52 gene=Nk52_evmTU1s52
MEESKVEKIIKQFSSPSFDSGFLKLPHVDVSECRLLASTELQLPGELDSQGPFSEEEGDGYFVTAVLRKKNSMGSEFFKVTNAATTSKGLVEFEIPAKSTEEKDSQWVVQIKVDLKNEQRLENSRGDISDVLSPEPNPIPVLFLIARKEKQTRHKQVNVSPAKSPAKEEIKKDENNNEVGTSRSLVYEGTYSSTQEPLFQENEKEMPQFYLILIQIYREKKPKINEDVFGEPKKQSSPQLKKKISSKKGTSPAFKYGNDMGICYRYADMFNALVITLAMKMYREGLSYLDEDFL